MYENIMEFLEAYNKADPMEQREVRLMLNIPTNEDALEFLSSLDNFQLGFAKCEEHPEIWIFIAILEHTIYINRCATEHDQIKIVPTLGA